MSEIKDKVKNFFAKKRAEQRFKTAGPGQKLNEPSKPNASGSKKKKNEDEYIPQQRSGLTSESKAAASAALARLEGKKPDAPGFNTSLAAIKAQVKRELEAEKATAAAAAATSTAQAEASAENQVKDGMPSQLAVNGVCFKCPMVSDEVLSYNEWQGKIREFLKEQFPANPALTAILMVQSLNKNKEKVQVCIDTLIKYLENIVQNPTEEKYRKIRKTNKIYLERITPIEGASLVIEGAGFVTEGEFYVFPSESVNEENLTNLEMLIDAMKCAEPIALELDRNLQVLIPSQARVRANLPREFFILSPEELKREQQAKAEAIEKSSMLMTKAMREREEMRELRNYRFCLIRIRFPDGMMLQGTFGVNEPFSAVTEFVEECLEDAEAPFSLLSPLGETLNQQMEKSLLELKLVPASILIFKSEKTNQLKPEIVILCQQLSISS